MRSAIRLRRALPAASHAGNEGRDRFPRHTIAQAFGATLRELRRARSFSQEHLAEVAGLHRTYTSLLERGLRTPTLTAIVRLADALGVTSEYLVKETMARRPLHEKLELTASKVNLYPDEPADASES